MKKIKVLGVETLVSIAKIFGDSSRGLTEKEIKHFLKAADIPDLMPLAPKWIRLYNAFSSIQSQTGYGNNVIAFIHKIMKPDRYEDTDTIFKWRLANLNPKLKQADMILDDSGKIISYKRDDPAVNKFKFQWNSLHSNLVKRGVNPIILKYFKSDANSCNNYAIVTRIVELIENRICDLSGLADESEKLIVNAFGFEKKDKPLIAINNFKTDHEKAEQKAFISLIIGLIGQVKITASPKKKILWDIANQDALEILTLASYILKKLEKTHIYIDF